jgi:hypothetical protein
VPVGGTAYDFRSLHPIGEYIRDTNLPDGTSGPFKPAADRPWLRQQLGPQRLRHRVQGWPSVVLNPGATFTSMTAYKFSIEGRGLNIHFH